MQNIIKRILPKVSESDYQKSFHALDLDSIDLVSLRVEIENHLGKMVPNQDWLGFQNLQDIFSYAEKLGFGAKTSVEKQQQEVQVRNQNFINMPQMCLEALSENWLFKEAGNLHWELLCDGLQTSSSELKDDVGNRLYATFVRIRIDGSGNLSQFQENKPYEFGAELSRYGMGMFFSDINFQSENQNIKIKMMTSFSVRKSTGDNKSLAKSQPTVDHCDIKQNTEFPAFGNEYRLIKKGELNSFFCGDYVFKIEEEHKLFSYEYSLNPYYDLNGVGLLYFASYPIISDFCELQYFRAEKDQNWEEHYYTLFRDIMYYANCDAQDKIIYVLNSVEELKDNKIKIGSTLYRKSDGKIMARIFTVKQKRED